MKPGQGGKEEQAMTIFDGVDISPTTPSTLHRVIPFGLLVLRTLYEAGKNRDRRLEAQAQGRELTSVREMMERLPRCPH